LGKDRAGHEAPQIFLLNPRSGKRRQLTYQSRQPTFTPTLDPVMLFIGFLDARTIAFYSGYPFFGTSRGHRVATDGRGMIEDLPLPTATVNDKGHIVIDYDFKVTSPHPRAVLVTFPGPSTSGGGPHPDEVFLIDHDRLLQLTNFGRFDTGF